MILGRNFHPIGLRNKIASNLWTSGKKNNGDSQKVGKQNRNKGVLDGTFTLHINGSINHEEVEA